MNQTRMADTQDGAPSIMKSQRQADKPWAIFICPTPYAIAPPNAPARVAEARIKAPRNERSEVRYQKVRI